jgi:Scaffold protein Nfu/NifU N terminal
MPFAVTKFESTPNPNAVKCWLDKPISDRPRSFLNAEMAKADAVAAALFAQAGATNVLFNGDWVTINKQPAAEWATIKAKVRRVLKEAE